MAFIATPLRTPCWVRHGRRASHHSKGDAMRKIGGFASNFAEMTEPLKRECPLGGSAVLPPHDSANIAKIANIANIKKTSRSFPMPVPLSVAFTRSESQLVGSAGCVGAILAIPMLAMLAMLGMLAMLAMLAMMNK